MRLRQSMTEAPMLESSSTHGMNSHIPVAEPALDPNDFCFPFQDAIRPGESGQGYALRMAEDNGLSGLPQLKAWLGKSRFATLDAADAPLIHRWFGAHEEQLNFALGNTAMGRPSEGYSFAGKPIGRSYFLNRSYPRVCPECLKEDGHCRIDWDISLAVACAVHGTLLVDCCEFCRRKLSWNRPLLGACSCGMKIAARQPPEVATNLEVQFSTWVDGQVRGMGMVRQKSMTSLMRLLSPLSLDGGFHIVYALSTAAGYDDQYTQTLGRPKTPLRKAQRVLVMANDLADKIAGSRPVQFTVSRPSVVVHLLAESACAQENPADRSLAHSILAAVLHYKKKSTVASVNPHLAQMELF